MDAFQSPTTDTPESELDLADAVPPIWVRLIGALFGASGFFMLGSSAQLFVFFYLTTPLKVVAVAMGLLGFASVAVAPFVFNARAWAAITGTFLGVSAALFSVVWVLWALTHGLFSPMMLISAALAVVSALFLPFSVPASLRATRARAALYS